MQDVAGQLIMNRPVKIKPATKGHVQNSEWNINCVAEAQQRHQIAGSWPRTKAVVSIWEVYHDSSPNMPCRSRFNAYFWIRGRSYQ